MIRSLGRTFSAFRSRAYRLYWTGAFVSMVGTWVQGTAQTYLVWELTRSPLATSLPMFFFTLPSMLFSLVGGVIADRTDRRRLIIVTQALFMAQSVILAALTWFKIVRVEHIYILAFISGLIMAVDAPARQALVPRLVDRDDLSNAIALHSLVFNVSRVIGPPIGGLLYAAAGPALPFGFNCVTYLAILYVLVRLRLPAEENGIRTTMWTDLQEGLAYVRAHPVVRTLLLLVSIMGFFGFSYVVLMPVMTSRVFGGGPAENGYLLGVAGAGATAGALLVAGLGPPARPGLRILTMGLVAGSALLGFSFARSMGPAIAALFVVGGAMIGFLATANATIQNLVPDALRGRVMSLYSLALIGSGPLNSLFAGTLGNVVGAPGALAAAGVMIILPVTYLYLRARNLHAFGRPGAAALPAVTPR